MQRYLLTVGTADRYRTTFNLLSNQIRSGGIGAYASMLAECRLADMQNLTLRPLGVELAQAFPSAGRLDVCADDGDFSKSAIREWGGRANPSCITAEESRLLQIALSGSAKVAILIGYVGLRFACLRCCRRRLSRGYLANGLSHFGTESWFAGLCPPTALRRCNVHCQFSSHSRSCIKLRCTSRSLVDLHGPGRGFTVCPFRS